MVSTTDRILNRAQELENRGIEAKGYIADLMNREDVEKLVEAVIGDFGKRVLLDLIMFKLNKPRKFIEFSRLFSLFSIM
ncbi:MAG: hypothetical protein MJA31_15205 [Clostridia bacterium]|nr:hypothetical protein [Clostridia bacterium]